MSASLDAARLTTATLLVSGCAPPAPSIWRASLPTAATSTRSRKASSAGKSSLRKYSPFELPPRINEQRMAVCMPRMVRRTRDALLLARSAVEHERVLECPDEQD